METMWKVTVSVAGAIASYLYGGWSALLGILVAFVVFDYASGVAAAAVEGQLSSSVGFRGILRKVEIFVIVAVAHLADRAIGNGRMFMDAAIFFYLGNELLSNIENAGRIGVPIPPIIMKAVEVLRGKAGVKEDTHADPGVGPGD